MRPTPFKIDQFGPLNLRDDPGELGMSAATDLLNVDFDQYGRLRTRYGYSTVYTGPAGENVTNMMAIAGGDEIIASFSGDSVKVVDVGAGTATTTTTLGHPASSFAQVGSSGGVYFTNGTTGQIRRYAASTITSPAGLAGFEGVYVATQPRDGRLLIADANDRSKMWFSNPDAPETIGSTDWVQVTPGDGQKINGLIEWNNLIFAFKETKFAVFGDYGTDVTGGTVFNHAMVDTGIGVLSNSPYTLVASHPSGVYFIGKAGIYRTTGGPPVEVSGAIRPVFKGAGMTIPAPFSSTIASPIDSNAWVHLAATPTHLYATGFDTSYFQFVMAFDTGAWTVHQGTVTHESVLGASPVDSSLGTYDGAVLLGGSDGTIRISDSSKTTDGGSNISWRWQSGWTDYGRPDVRKSVGRYAEIWGSGSPTVSMFTDYGSSDSLAAAVTLGTSPAVARGYNTTNRLGVYHSLKLSGTSPASVTSVSMPVEFSDF